MAVGVDMGSSRIIVAVAKQGGVEILCNEGSYRSTPCVVAYTDQRVVGDQAKTLIKKNFKNSVRYPLRFLTPRASQYSFEREFSFSKAKVNQRESYNELVFNVNFNKTATDFNSRQVAAGLFHKIKQILETNGSDVKDIVVSVPSFFTQVERQALLEAGQIAGINVVRLYNESTANVMNYGIFRKKDLNDDKPRLVGFVDVGDSKTSVFFAKIWKNKAEILYEKNLLTVGTRNFDMNMMNLYLDKFEEMNNLDDHRDSPKVRIRLLDAIQKQRKILSANTEAPINIECLFEDYDFFYNMTREEFETLNQSYIEQIRDLFLKVMTESKININDLHSIEIVGGGSRTPIVQSMIQDIMKKSPSKTLDASESISRGCAIKSAMVSPLFRVLDYDIKDRSHYTFKVGIKYKSDTQETIKTVFKEGSAFDNVVSMTINKNEEVDVRLFYEDKYDNNNLVLISSAVLPASNPQSTEYKSKLYFELDNSGLAQLLKFEIIEKFTEEVKEEKKDNKIEEEGKEEENNENKIEEEKPTEVKTKDVFKTRKLPFTHIEYMKTGKVEMDQMKGIENQIMIQMEEIKMTQKAKYDLESFIYETRNQLGEASNKHFFTSQESELILKVCMEKEDWLYNDGRDAKKADYVNQREELASNASCLYTRKEKSSKINNFVGDAWKGFSEFQNQYAKALTLLKPDQISKLEKNKNQGLELVGEMNVVKNNPSPINFDAYNFESKSKQINKLYQEMLDVVNKAMKVEEERLRKEEQEKKKKQKEEEEKKKKIEEEAKAEAKKEETSDQKDNKIETE